MRIALAQIDPTVGDLQGNSVLLLDAYERAVAAGADLVVTGELALTGYPPDDLLLKPAFVAAVGETLRKLAASIGQAPLLVGFVDTTGRERRTSTVLSERETVRDLANAAAVLRDGRVDEVYRKQRIPNYGVFDEARYFQSGDEPLVFEAGGVRVGVAVCEDLWGDGGPLAQAAAGGADVLVTLNASPYEQGKRQGRERWAAHHASSHGAWFAYCNIVGGQDEVVFDGDSFVMAPDGTVTARGRAFTDDLVVTDVGGERWSPCDTAPLDAEAAVYEALVLGTRDYVRKNGFPGAIVAVSGGIDSAVTAAVAVDALGPGAVKLIAMPSPHSSPGSLADAEELAAALGAAYTVIPIEPMMAAFTDALTESFAGTPPGVAEENIQSRTRGTLVMALSNKFGDLVLATGNKSEFAVGYATLYGDMAGGLAVLKDVDKTTVYALARYRNRAYRDGWAGPGHPVIPESTITKPPSAELRPDQRDTDSLPPYELLDPILGRYVEAVRSVDEIVAEGFDRETVEEVARMVDRSEYKRRQAPPGIKVTSRAFGRDRRFPITQRWWS
jgi:NAD+ synthase (glutamine-hydrolysing)